MFIKGICAIIFSVKVIALYISVLLIISIFIVAIFNILLRSRKYRKNLTYRCNHLQIEVERLKKISEKKEQEFIKIKEHLKQVKAMSRQQSSFVESMISGAYIYNDIFQNKNLSQLSVRELNCFVKFYAQIDPDFSIWFIEKEKLLTQREIVICILIRMGKGKQKIINLLRCSDGSYRTLKNRIKSKLCTDIYKYEFEEYIKQLY